MSLFDWFADRRKTTPSSRAAQEVESGDGLLSKWPDVAWSVYRKDAITNAGLHRLAANHHNIDSAAGFGLMADEGSFMPVDRDLAPTDPAGLQRPTQPMRSESSTARAAPAMKKNAVCLWILAG